VNEVRRMENGKTAGKINKRSISMIYYRNFMNFPEFDFESLKSREVCRNL